VCAINDATRAHVLCHVVAFLVHSQPLFLSFGSISPHTRQAPQVTQLGNDSAEKPAEKLSLPGVFGKTGLILCWHQTHYVDSNYCMSSDSTCSSRRQIHVKEAVCNHRFKRHVNPTASLHRMPRREHGVVNSFTLRGPSSSAYH
jgi:hypothetical protein